MRLSNLLLPLSLAKWLGKGYAAKLGKERIAILSSLRLQLNKI